MGSLVTSGATDISSSEKFKTQWQLNVNQYLDCCPNNRGIWFCNNTIEVKFLTAKSKNLISAMLTSGVQCPAIPHMAGELRRTLQSGQVMSPNDRLYAISVEKIPFNAFKSTGVASSPPTLEKPAVNEKFITHHWADYSLSELGCKVWLICLPTGYGRPYHN